MSELILKTKTDAEFWTDTDDCTAEGNFNVFYFAAHDDEQPQAVASDCESWAAAADQLAGYVKPADWEAFKYEFLSAQVPIVESIDIDWSSRDVFDFGHENQQAAFSGIAYLSPAFTDPNDQDKNALVFNLYVPLFGAAFISWCSPLPANFALGEEALEAAALQAIGSEELESQKQLQINDRLVDRLGELCERMDEVVKAAEQLDEEVDAMDTDFHTRNAIASLAFRVYRLKAEIETERDFRGQ